MTIVDVAQAKRTLDSMLTDYDRRVSARYPNIYRLGHLLGASDRVWEGLGETADASLVAKKVDRHFIVGDLPPARNFIKLLNSQPPTPDPSRAYLEGWPKTRAKRKKSVKSPNPKSVKQAQQEITDGIAETRWAEFESSMPGDVPAHVVGRIREAWFQGFESGAGAYKYTDVQEGESRLDAAYESEQNSRDYSPFEFVARDINSLDETLEDLSETGWAAYDDGVDAGIKAQAQVERLSRRAKRRNPRATATRGANPVSRKKKSHKDVEFHVENAPGFGAKGTEIYKTAEDASAFAVAKAMSHGGPVHMDVVIWSESGAKWFGGDDGLEIYREDPDASIHRRIVVRAEDLGRIY